MRNISFMLTTEQIRNRTKTVTRRLGWTNLKPGTLLCGVEKSQGLKPGETVNRLAVIRVKNTRIESLDALIDNPIYGRSEVRKEGFPTMTAEEFVAMFCRHMECDSERAVTRIEFEYVDGVL